MSFGRLPARAALGTAFGLDDLLQIGTHGNEHGGDRSTHEHPLRVQVEPVSFELKLVAVLPLQDTPGLVVGDQFHALEQLIRDPRPTVRTAAEGIGGCQALDRFG